MIKVILTDFYGVVYDNFDWQVIYERVHSDPKKSDQLQGMIRQINQGLIDNETFQQGIAILAEDDKHPGQPAVYPHPTINRALLDYLRTLHGSVKIGLFSNGYRQDVVELVEQGSYGDVFDEIIVSSQLGTFKPSPEAFVKALNLISPGVKPEEAIMLDDSPRHVVGASEAGLHAIKYTDVPSAKTEIEKLVSHA